MRARKPRRRATKSPSIGSSPSTTVLVACFAACLSVASDAVADTIFPSGREAQLADMLGQDGDLPGGCVWLGGSVDPRVALSRYRCGSSSNLVLELHPPDGAVIPDARTEKFLIVRRSPETPAELFDAVKARIRAREAAWEWGHVEGHAGNPQRELWRFYATTGAIVAFLLVATTWLVVARARHGGVRRTDSAPDSQPIGPPLGRIALVGAVGLVLLMATRARFVWDDYRFLLRAVQSPWRPDESLAFFSTTLPYWVGTRLQLGVGFYAAINVVTWGIAVALWGCLMRRAGFSQREAMLAAALYAVGPGAFDLVRWPAGFQQLAAFALIWGVLLVFDLGARTSGEHRRAERAAWLAMAVALTAIGTQIKFAVTALVPVTTWLWGRLVVPHPERPFDRRWPYGLIAAGYVVPVVTARFGAERGDLSGAGFGEFTQNMLRIGEHLWPSARGLLAAVLIGMTASYAFCSRQHQASEDMPRLGVRIAAALRSRFGRSPLVALVVVASALLALPYLLNEHYVMPYYALLAYAPITAFGARLLTATSSPGWRGWLIGLVMLAVLVPYGAIRRNMEPNEWNQCQRLLEEAGALLATQARPAEVVLQARCSTPVETRRSDDSLRALFRAASNEVGFRWATGWDDLHVRIEDSEHSSGARAGTIQLSYCRDRSPAFSIAALSGADTPTR